MFTFPKADFDQEIDKVADELRVRVQQIWMSHPDNGITPSVNLAMHMLLAFEYKQLWDEER